MKNQQFAKGEYLWNHTSTDNEIISIWHSQGKIWQLILVQPIQIEEDGLDFTERIPFMTFWREHGKMSVYKHFDEKGCLHSCFLFESQDKKYAIVNFNEWLGAATYHELQACKRHILVYHLTDGTYVAYGWSIW